MSLEFDVWIGLKENKNRKESKAIEAVEWMKQTDVWFSLTAKSSPTAHFVSLVGAKSDRQEIQR